MAEKNSTKAAHGGAGYKRKGQKYKSLLCGKSFGSGPMKNTRFSDRLFDEYRIIGYNKTA